MKEIKLKFPWCTGVPRPTIIENIDEGECWVIYNTAQIVEDIAAAALIFSGFMSLKHTYLNDEKNPYLSKGYLRDSMVKEDETFILLLHNEVIEIKAKSYEERKTSYKSPEDILKEIKKKS